MKNPHIFYEDNHIIVVEKPVNIPSQEDNTGDMDMLTLIKKDLKERYAKPGNVFLGLVHRIDRPVGGVMVFAKTSKAASRLSEQIRTRKITKKYIAVTDKIMETVNGEWVELISYIEKDTSLNKVKIQYEPFGDAKYAKLFYSPIQKQKDRTLIEIILETGRPHQIRAQLAQCGFPIYGDAKYGNGIPGQQIALWANELCFFHPVTKEKLIFTSFPDKNCEPWKKFMW